MPKNTTDPSVDGSCPTTSAVTENKPPSSETTCYGNGLITNATSAPIVPFPDLSPDDIHYRDEREQIVTHAVNQSLAAAKALHEIKTYRDGMLWRSEFRTFADYCSRRWGYEKSHAYRHVKVGNLLAVLDQQDSPIGENAGVNFSHLRSIVENVPEELQVECWKKVTESIPEGGKLTATHVKTGAKRFLKKNGVEPKTAKRETPAKADNRELAARDVAKLRSSLSKLPEPERFDPLLEEISLLIQQSFDGVLAAMDATELTVGNRNDQIDPAFGAHDLLTTNDSEPECEATPAQKKDSVTAEKVMAAMDDDGPPEKRNIATAEPINDRLSTSSVTNLSDRTAPAMPESHSDAVNFMDAQLFHAASQPGGDFGKWLYEIAAMHPADVRIFDSGGAHRLSLIRAKHYAYKVDGLEIYNLVTEAMNSGNSNPGATADALFEKHTGHADAAAPDDECDLRRGDTCEDAAFGCRA